MAHTKKSNVFGTVLAPSIHPVLAAKQCVTVDLIGDGRFGLNIVCGWNQDEFEMFWMVGSPGVVEQGGTSRERARDQ